MRSHQQDLIRLITESSENLSTDILPVLKTISARGLANMFVDTSFLITALEFVKEQYWIQNKDSDKEIIFSNFVKKFFKTELTPALFFHSTLENSSIQQIELFQKNSQTVQKIVIDFAKAQVLPKNKEFAMTALKLMSELFEFEYQLVMNKKSKNLYLGYSLYRTFDGLDAFFSLNYNAENSITNNTNNSERLYEGSGVAVQSSYATLLLALRYLRLATGSRFIDLGSGYGRVGLVVGLLRPDIKFTGYEFVNDRVAMACAASKSLGINSHVQFFTQDLSNKDFSIPEAETYYMYDPFTADTYKHVMDQLALVAKKIKINIITKGNAKAYIKQSPTGLWSKPQEFDGGNFCLFRSN